MKYALLMLFMLPCSVFAQTASKEMSRYELEEEFRALDLNGDGYVTLAEAAGLSDVVTRFDKADRNRDGKLSRAEYSRLKTMKQKRGGSAAVGGTAARHGSKPKP